MRPRGRYERDELALAGIALDRPLSMEGFPRPTGIRVEGGRLIWSGLDLDNRIRPGPGLLAGFLRLGNASPVAIKRFAERSGVLELCQHDLPSLHSPACRPRGKRGEFQWEPIDAWRYYARQAAALLNVAARLHRDEPGRAEDWNVIYERPLRYLPQMLGELDLVREMIGLGSIPDHRRLLISLGGVQLVARPFRRERQRNEVLAAQRFVLAAILNYGWLGSGGVRPSFQWAGSPRVVLLSGNLFGAVAAHLMFAIAKTQGLAICSACGMPFIPSRQPTPGRRSYCPSCGRQAAVRDASRAYRRRLRNRSGRPILS